MNQQIEAVKKKPTMKQENCHRSINTELNRHKKEFEDKEVLQIKNLKIKNRGRKQQQQKYNKS